MTLYEQSISIIRAGQHASGAYVASPTFSQYGYCWLRDGAWIAYGMDCSGQHASARTFYEWVGWTLTGQLSRLERLLAGLERGDVPGETDYLPTRYTLDGQIGSDFWWDFQLDGYGTWLWGLAAHIDFTGDRALLTVLKPAVQMTIRYLAALWQAPNYDCWEEHRDQIHTSTLAAIYGGLTAIQRHLPHVVPPDLPPAIRGFVLDHAVDAAGHFVKFLGNPAVDASLLWTAVPFGVVDVTDEVFTRTLAKIETDLHRPGGGVYRYAADTYYGGGEWVLLTAWLAWTYVELGRVDDARRLLDWITQQVRPGSGLPEQVSEHRLHPTRYAEWETRWGAIACPLLWSHSMYLVALSQLDKRV